MHRKYHLYLKGFYTFRIIYAIYPFLPTIPRLFPGTFHQGYNSQPGIPQHIAVPHGIPGIRYIYQERYNTCRLKWADFFVRHPSHFRQVKLHHLLRLFHQKVTILRHLHKSHCWGILVLKPRN